MVNSTNFKYRSNQNNSNRKVSANGNVPFQGWNLSKKLDKPKESVEATPPVSKKMEEKEAMKYFQRTKINNDKMVTEIRNGVAGG